MNDSAVRIDTFGVVTLRRPAALARCLTSYIVNAARHGRTLRCVVCDDAAAPQDRAACRDVARATAKVYGCAVQYIGLEEKLIVLRELIRTRDVPPDVVPFAFFDVERVGASDGGNRNVLLLETCAAPILMADDDTICMTRRPLGYRDAASARQTDEGERWDPSDVWMLGVGGDERDACRAESLDFFGEHERWLGRSIDAASTIRVTTNGTVGDCGWGSPSPFLFLRGSSLARLTASNDRYDDYTTSRRVVRAASRVTIAARTDDFMSGCFAVDARTMLPPFPPVGRGADRVFASLVAKCCARARWAHLPIVLPHRPHQPRTFWRGEITRSAAGIDLCTLLCALLDVIPPPAYASDAERLAWYGTHLEEIASPSTQAFEAAAVDAVRRTLAWQIDALEGALASRAARATQFRRDVRAYLAALRRTSARADLHVPLDLRGDWPAEEARAVIQRIVRRFGQLLTHWPRLLHLRREMLHDSHVLAGR